MRITAEQGRVNFSFDRRRFLQGIGATSAAMIVGGAYDYKMVDVDQKSIAEAADAKFPSVTPQAENAANSVVQKYDAQIGITTTPEPGRTTHAQKDDAEILLDRAAANRGEVRKLTLICKIGKTIFDGAQFWTA